MRIKAIQPHNYHNQLKSKVSQPKLREETPKQDEQTAISFKGESGAFYGLGGGLILGLAGFASGVLTGGLAVPAIIGAMGVVGTGAAGAYAGDKIEDKLSGGGKKD